jgi:DNA-binding response OmpR family regulator
MVDDEVKILEMVSAYLEKAGYKTLCAKDGRQALALLQRNDVSLVLLDLMLPDMAGEILCKRIRGGQFNDVDAGIPIIMITAKIDELSIVAGLNAGADDYVTKPFSPRELMARIAALLRRTVADIKPARVILSDLVIDTENMSVTQSGKTIDLTRNEFNILALLASRPHKIFTRDEIIDKVKGEDFDGFDRAIDVHIKNLRQKTGDDKKNPRYIETIYGMGYRCVL